MCEDAVFGGSVAAEIVVVELTHAQPMQDLFEYA